MRATVRFPGGVVVEAEGTADEIARLAHSAEPVAAPTWPQVVPHYQPDWTAPTVAPHPYPWTQTWCSDSISQSGPIPSHIGDPPGSCSAVTVGGSQ